MLSVSTFGERALYLMVRAVDATGEVPEIGIGLCRSVALGISWARRCAGKAIFEPGSALLRERPGPRCFGAMTHADSDALVAAAKRSTRGMMDLVVILRAAPSLKDSSSPSAMSSYSLVIPTDNSRQASRGYRKGQHAERRRDRQVRAVGLVLKVDGAHCSSSRACRNAAAEGEPSRKPAPASNGG